MPKGIKGFQKGHKIRTGMKRTKEEKKKISEGCKKAGVGKWFIGRKFSEEHKMNMKRSAKKGEDNHKWKGGKFISSRGYVYILKPNHPFAVNGNRYIKRSRFVIEKKIGRYLKPEEVIHHINKIIDDDRIENLMLFNSQSEHIKFHYLKENL